MSRWVVSLLLVSVALLGAEVAIEGSIVYQESRSWAVAVAVAGTFLVSIGTLRQMYSVRASPRLFAAFAIVFAALAGGIILLLDNMALGHS